MLFTGKSIINRLSASIATTGVIVLAAGAITGSGQGGAVAAGTAEPYHPAPLTWAACPTPPVARPGEPQPQRLECAKLTVPLDYAEPHGETIQVALIRVRATDQAHRLGSLVFNFGGPGASGIDAFTGGVAAQFAKLGTRYDLVSFDPRGVGRSSPVTCVDDKWKDAWAAVDASPDDAGERAAFRAASRALIEGCEKRSGKVLPYVGTVSAARDMDVLRAALGERKLNYFGFSYGTWLGAGYAHLFPANVGRVVLDGAVNTKLDPVRFFLEQAAGFQRALGHYSRWAAQQPGARTTKNAVTAKIAALLDGLDGRPLATDSGRELTQSLGEAGVLAALYSNYAWPLLTQAIERAAAGDGTILLSLADALFQRSPDGHYTNYLDVSGAIYCASTPQRYTERDIAKALPAFKKASPVFGPTLAWRAMSCTGWPVEGDENAHKVDAPGAPPIVVIGNTGDPATPYSWAPALAQQLGSGVLLTLKGEGHGAYPTGDACIQGAVDGYLLNGRVPANGTTCPGTH
ncbi:alpha/beta fold hydrolase [Planotetraspora sp. A-T 1434]|uniref:alpha/beta hydrolase n=1 Tax=Planotetraspora sp. A-T 1434 TaxID=2979219 RepID=UPI0021C113A8|nr:alpha/beta hydrolase [Planotetraspora sp. A-T 1434]MCT9930429.1 alpha/beta fold hydrolase [Planotetraspora sp. A-T 1434]